MGERDGECVEAEHHPNVIADHHGPLVGRMEGHLALTLGEESLYLVLRDWPLVIKDEQLVGEDPAVEVHPAAAAHVPPDGDVPGPDVPLDPPVGQVCHREQGAEREVDVEHLAPIHRHLEVVDESPISRGLGHDLDAGLPGTPVDGSGVFLH